VNDDFERAVRASLAENARHAPDGDDLAERIIDAADHPRPVSDPHRVHPSRWRGWTLPLVAAGSVAAVVAAIVGAAQLHHTSARPGTTPTPTPSLTTAGPSTSPAVSSPTPSEQSTASSPPSTPPAQGPAGGPVPNAFQVADLTFVSADDGWALGTAECFKTPGQRCPALLRTDDGGQHWASVPNPPANLSINGDCADPCVAHIRFASKLIGYAYGPRALFLTTDGGATWMTQNGGADALETLAGNVVRVTTEGGCQPPGCTYRVLTAPNGSGQWHQADAPSAKLSGDGVVLGRTGDAAFLEILQHPAGGGESQQPTLLTSTDGGHKWTDRGTPCPQNPGPTGEVDSDLMATAADGSVTLLCTPRLADSAGRPFTVTSTDGGAGYRPGGRQSLGSARISALGAASASVLLVSSDDTYRSDDGGQTWRRLDANAGSGPGAVSWFGFESATVGRAISSDGRTVWTTPDAGKTWSAHKFS
jgi:photosystem II stability/assembly factor-like uncharacterized protein